MSKKPIDRSVESRVCFERGSGADRIVEAIKPGVRYGDAAYAAMTCRQITAGFDCHGLGIANWRL